MQLAALRSGRSLPPQRGDRIDSHRAARGLDATARLTSSESIGVPAKLLNPLCDRPPVLRLERDGPQNPQVERALTEIGRFSHVVVR